MGLSVKDIVVNPSNTNPAKWSNTLKQFAGNSRQTCLRVFDHFVRLALKGLRKNRRFIMKTVFKTVKVKSGKK